jgi:alpha-1,2-mannosyltransferase
VLANYPEVPGKGVWILTAGRSAVVAVLAVVNVAVIGWFVLSFHHGALAGVYRMDLDVYRAGVDVWWHGGDLYGQLPVLRNGWYLPFIYPPFAVVLLAPLAAVPFGVASAALALLTIVAVVFVVVVVLRSLNVLPAVLVVGVALPVALMLEPVRETLYFGQINVVLMALVVADCLVRSPRWPRGVLVGMAAAIKLTPLVFVLFFLLRGDRRAAITAGLSFLCATGAGFLLSWSNSVRFWTEQVLFGTQSRGLSNQMNQSLKVMLVRLGSDGGVVWLVLAVAVLATTAVGMRRAFATGQGAWALGLNALGGLLISPVSYSHHWVWAVPILLIAAVTAWRTRTRAAIAVAMGGTFLFVLSPHWWWDPAAPWTTWHLLTGNSYVIAGVIVIAVAGLWRRSAVRAGRPHPVDQTATAAQDLAEGIERMLVVLREHLVTEEQRVVPLMEQHITQAEWNQMVQSGAANVPPEVASFGFGMMMYEGDPEVIDAAIANMPPEAQPLIRRLGSDAYAAKAKEVYGTASPPRSTEL